MSLDQFMEFIFLLWIYDTAALFFVYFLIGVCHVLMPKRILTTYFKAPYFKPGEIAIFSGFPYAYIRTVMFMRLLAYPSSGAKRGLVEAHLLAPNWFRLMCKVVLLAFGVTFSVFVLAVLIFMLDMIIHDN